MCYGETCNSHSADDTKHKSSLVFYVNGSTTQQSPIPLFMKVHRYFPIIFKCLKILYNLVNHISHTKVIINAQHVSAMKYQIELKSSRHRMIYATQSCIWGHMCLQITNINDKLLEFYRK